MTNGDQDSNDLTSPGRPELTDAAPSTPPSSNSTGKRTSAAVVPGSASSSSTSQQQQQQQHRAADSSCVQVAVRVRPLLALEGDDESCMHVLPQSQSIQVGGAKGPQFTFDQVFGMDTQQSEFYQQRVAQLVVSCLEGYNATLLAYGQTGSGKTHTIMGPNTATLSSKDGSLNNDAGVIPRAIGDLFDNLDSRKKEQDVDYQVSVQFLELYGEEIRDLLTSNRRTGSDKLSIRDLGTDEPEVVGATQELVTSAPQALQCLSHGMLRRVTGATAMNESSSRSHAILSVCVEQSTVVEGEERVRVTRSKFSFVDLAGAERQKRTGATGKRLQEGIDINKGLSNLGNVISALGDPRKRGKTHVPYRDAKLTRLLKGSLGGNHKTLMIACVSPAAVNMGESLNCLRYANRAKNIQNRAIVNVDANTRLVQELQGQVKALATDFLKSLDGEQELQFTREALVALVDDGATPTGPAPFSPMSPTTPTKSVPLDADSRLRETEVELRRARDLLQKSRDQHDAAELELHTVRAQNVACDAQIAALTADRGGPVQPATEQAFVTKAVEYEQEIADLREELRQSDAKSNRIVWGSPEVEDKELQQDEKDTRIQRDRLLSIRAAMSLEDGESAASGTFHTACDFDSNDGMLPVEGHKPNDVETLASKYLPAGGYESDENLDPVESAPSLLDSDQRVIQCAADLEELSQSIEMKERLISQIKRNKEREAMMRLFYEEKLAELKHALEEKESERDQLLAELKEATKEKSGVSDALKTRLEEKQQQIEKLKSMQHTYRKQTTDASKKGADLLKLKDLQGDVKNMKKKKVEMQKELAYEKRSHAKELTKLNKTVMQKDREINKIQKISNQRGIEASKAKAVSKNRLQELANLKKALRSYKSTRLDPVLIGKRQPKPKNTTTRRTSNDKSTDVTVDSDVIRAYFDKKVISIAEKEALVDKLAKEWEDYFDLNTQLAIAHEGEEDEVIETLQVQIQFKNDNIRKLAQKLGKKQIGSISPRDGVPNHSDAFLFDKVFDTKCKGSTLEASRSAAARVLFGMVVRERRRVAALAKTASSLDERLQIAEQASEVNAAALRTCVDEHRHEVADLEQKQQDHIMSLMSMVQGGLMSKSSGTDDRDASPVASNTRLQKKLLVLANERVAQLEDQLSELRANCNSKEMYLSQLEDVKDLLAIKTGEYDCVLDERNELRSEIRKIRNEAAKHKDDVDSTLSAVVVDLSDAILNHTGDETTIDRPRISSPLKTRTAILQHTDSESLSDDSDLEETERDWGADMMADLALIAEGKVPDSLNVPEVLEGASKLEDGSVFDRLANPKSFTGTQKRAAQGDKKTTTSHNVSAADSCNDDRLIRPASRDASEQPSLAVCSPDVLSDSDTTDQIVSPRDSTQEHYQSVFERLGSPSHWTGTQKEKFHETRVRRDQSAEEAADRVLGVILDEKSDNLQSREDHSPTARMHNSKHSLLDRLETDAIDSVVPNTEAITEIPLLLANEDEITEEKMRSENGSSEKADAGRKAYAKLNVFDRLQKTTTHASAARQSETLHVDSRDSRLSGADAKGQSLVSSEVEAPANSRVSTRRSSADTSSEFVRQSVFERLNKTKTEAYAKKSNR